MVATFHRRIIELRSDTQKHNDQQDDSECNKNAFYSCSPTNWHLIITGKPKAKYRNN